MAGTIKWSFERVGRTDSTQEVARKLAGSGAEEGTVVVALTQTSGRGRKGRAWLSPAGGLYMSLILRPKRSGGVQLLPLVGSFAVADGIKKDTGIVPFVRWPNDVLVGGKKVAGVIAECAYRGKNLTYAIVGVGINCNAATESLGEYAPFSTSIAEELGVEVDLTILRDKVLECFARIYAEWERSGKVVERRKEWISTIGRKVEITRGHQTKVYLAEDVKGDGSLIVRSGKDRTVLRVEEVERLRES